MVLGKISQDELLSFSTELQAELGNILQYWQKKSVDHLHGGFLGKVDNTNKVYETAPKSIILNTRILWTFSKAGNFYGDSRYDEECQRAFSYLIDNFRDFEHDGVHWMLDYLGNPIDKRKQIYAQAFCLYALSEYYKYSKNPRALVWAQEIFDLIESKAYDSISGGYLEAFGSGWGRIEDMRLSQKDLNAPKTTNTHLHILEAYTTFLEISPTPKVAQALKQLLELFLNRIFDHNNHMKLFFSKDWKKISNEISYGHDIEAAWLLIHAARVLKAEPLIRKVEDLALEVTKTFVNEALDSDFGVINSKDTETLEVDLDRHWWPQAEAMVGLMYAWRIIGDSNYFNICQQVWIFIQDNIIDKEYGEWYFRVNPEGRPYLSENKIGPWKCPYHNSRALIEILQILGKD